MQGSNSNGATCNARVEMEECARAEEIEYSNLKVRHGSRCSSGAVFFFLTAVFCLLLGLVLELIGVQKLAVREFLKAENGSKFYEYWSQEKSERIHRFWLFNITNYEKIVAGDEGLKFQQLGPYVYKEYTKRTDISFNDDGTMSYENNREVVFDPYLSSNCLSENLISFNIEAMHHEVTPSPTDSLVSDGLLVITHQALLATTAGNLLGRQLNAVVDSADRTGGLHDQTSGFLSMFFCDTKERISIRTTDNFMQVAGFQSERQRNFTNCRNNFRFGSFLAKDESLHVCRHFCHTPLEFTYEREVSKEGTKGYMYLLSDQKYCYGGDFVDDTNGSFNHPGLHFYLSLPGIKHDDQTDVIEATISNSSLQDSYIIVEPTLGFTLESRLGLQLNMVLQESFSGSSNSTDDIVIPMFRVETVTNLPDFYTKAITYYVHTLPGIVLVVQCLLYAVATISILVTFAKLFHNPNDHLVFTTVEKKSILTYT